MQIKSDIDNAKEKTSSIKNNVDNFTKLLIIDISGSNIESLYKLNYFERVTQELLQRYKTIAQRDGENISLLAEQFGKLDEENKKLFEK